jgi:hypothetical protein
MKLIIRIKNGQPYQHPMTEENFRQAFPHIDTNTDDLPEGFVWFERVDRPAIGVYEYYEGVSYEWRDGIVKDVHRARALTEEEIKAKQESVKESWAKNPYAFASWSFDEALCCFVPPAAYPTDGGMYQWDESTTSWVAVEE